MYAYEIPNWKSKKLRLSSWKKDYVNCVGDEWFINDTVPVDVYLYEALLVSNKWEEYKEEQKYKLITLPLIGECFKDFYNEATNQVEFILYPITDQEYTHEEALKYAESLEQRLLTKEEFYLLMASLEDLGVDYFWSASVVANDRYCAWMFDGDNGYIDYDFRGNSSAVRCVGPRIKE